MRKQFTLSLVLAFLATSLWSQIERIGKIDDASYADLIVTDKGEIMFIYLDDLSLHILNSEKTEVSQVFIDTTGINAGNSELYTKLFSNYITNKLVDDDDGIETLMEIEFYNNTDHAMFLIIDDDGSIIFKQDWSHNYITDQFIKSYDDHSIMILDSAKTASVAYKLPGVLPEYTKTEATASINLSLSNDTLSLSNGSKVFLGNYNNTDSQQLSISNDTVYLTNGGWVYIGTENTNQVQGTVFNADNISSVYPNPASGKAYLSYNLGKYTNGTLIIYDASGKINEEVYICSEKGILELDLSRLMPGNYFYNIQTNKGNSQLNKLIIQ
jgi:hypothetical protein